MRKIQDLNLSEARKELEFLATRCFISGFGNRLACFQSHLNFYFNPPSEEECKWFESQTKERLPRTSEEFRVCADKDFNVLSRAYERLPWSDLIYPNSLPRKQIYAPLASINTHLLTNMPSLVAKTLNGPAIASLEYELLRGEIKFIGLMAQRFWGTVVELQRKIKEESEEVPRYHPSFEIHPGYKESPLV